MRLSDKVKNIQKTFFALGTANTISLRYLESKEAEIIECLNECKAYVLSMDDRLSVFKEDSEISRVNHSAGEHPVEVSEDTFRIIERAIYFSRLSEGAFDITSGVLSRLWSIGKRQEYIPDDSKIKEAQKLISWESIKMYTKPYRIALEKHGQSIDLGGIAKGYAADKTKSILIQHGITDALINFGGTVISVDQGNDNNETPRNVGIQSPYDKMSSFGTLFIKDAAVVTSGVYEKYFMKNGIRYHHILHPKTGYPADAGLISATLIGNSAMDLDALATIFILLGLEKGMSVLKDCKADGIFITGAGEIFITEGIRDRFTIDKPGEKEGAERVGYSYEQ